MARSKPSTSVKKPKHKRKGPTPSQIANRKRRGPLITPPEGSKPDPYAGLYGNRNAVGNSGRPPAYETPEEMQTQIDSYFEYVKGERGVREVQTTVYNKTTRKWEEKTEKEEYWVRVPEPPTRTGLMLYMGFCSHAAWDTYKEKKDTEFPAVVARGLARVEMNYERALLDRDASNGAKFALSNLDGPGWRNTQNVQALGKDGKPVDPAAPQTNIINVSTVAESLGKV
jgi:hypothetical protein